MRASGALAPLHDPEAGATLTVGSPVWIEGQDKTPARPAPALGQHTVEVLREAGFTDAEIDDLRRDKIIFGG